MSQILAALKQLDKTNDAHWTTDGLPRIDAIKSLTGDQTLGRDDITIAAPGFTRTNMQLPGAQAAQAAASGTATGTLPIAAPAGAVPELAQANGGDDGEVHQEAAQSADTTDQPVTERSALEAELAGAQAVLAEIEQAFVRAEAVRSEARAEVDRLLNAVDALPKAASTATVLGYLASQARELELRAKQRAQLRESNVDLKALTALTAGAPVDNAMARRRAFSALRPQV